MDAQQAEEPGDAEDKAQERGEIMTNYKLSKCPKCKGLLFALVTIIEEAEEREVMPICANCWVSMDESLASLEVKLFLDAVLQQRKVN